jgi:hypothetical protein
VLLTPKNPRRIAWNHALHRYFRRHFGLVRHQDTAEHLDTYNLYARDGTGQLARSRRAAMSRPAITAMPHRAGPRSLPLHGANEKPAR